MFNLTTHVLVLSEWRNMMLNNSGLGSHYTVCHVEDGINKYALITTIVGECEKNFIIELGLKSKSTYSNY